jgi:hypothetical protein
MSKSNYIDCLNEISNEELFEGLLGYGYFSEKLPPIFSSVMFYDNADEIIKIFKNISDNDPHDYIRFGTVRNTGGLRIIGIPHPLGYLKLCKFLSNHWSEIKDLFKIILASTNSNHNLNSRYFSCGLKNANYVSQIHIRKKNGTKSLFEMRSYENNFELSSDDQLMLGNKFFVNADISSCFPSMYTHSIPWVIVGKETAKNNRSDKEWFNKLDKYCRNINNGETKGLLIGPAASNLISELILSKIDSRLIKRYSYIRFIDDYHCFVQSYEDGEGFLRDLESLLDEYRLTLNYNKIKISKLPVEVESYWPLCLKSNNILQGESEISYTQIKYLYSKVIRLMEENGEDAAIINYFIKMISKRKLSYQASRYFTLYSMHMALLFPYLVRILNDFVFKVREISIQSIQSFSQELYKRSIARYNTEGICYSIYFALIYHISLKEVELISAKELNTKMKKWNNCILNLLLWLYFKQNNDEQKVNVISDYAKYLLAQDMDRNWLFVYEVLNAQELKEYSDSNIDYWSRMKKLGISFLSQEFIHEIF